MQSQGFINKTGLTFSFSDVNFDTKSLNLVPILLETPETETITVNSKIKDDVNKPPIMIKANEFSEKVKFTSKLSDLNPEVAQFCNFNKPHIVPETIVDIQNNQQETFSNVSELDNYSSRGDIFSISKSSVIEDQDNNLSIQYEAISYYWFYCVIINGLAEWKPFSLKDSNRIELKFCQYFKNRDTYDLVDDCVPTDGGRYDVFIRKRQKLSVYWEEAPMEIRRASWFYRPEDESFYLPYSESECDKLEEKYKYILENNLWHQPFELGGNTDRGFEDRFVFHTPNTMVEYRRCGYLTGSDNITKGRVVYRGIEGFKNHLEQGESDAIDHVMFVIHGIGSTCDMAGRGVVDCVKSMRSISSTMLKSHFTYHKGRVELIPVSWHSKFHSERISFDKDLSKVTLKSVPKLRNFTNNTLVDVLCYSSPTYCQTILTIVATEMNRLRHLFVSRNPQYDGTISIAGHSLGSMIAFDLVHLQHDQIDKHLVPLLNVNGVPRLEFEVGHLFALGSPISLLLTARGHSFLGEEFYLPHCKGFFNIFHPFDPVAYRLEPMLVKHYQNRPIVIPHHKGRKRLHLELKDNLVRVGQDIKSKLFQTLKSTWSSLQEFATAHKTNLGEELADEDEMMRVLNKIDSNIGDRDDAGSTTTEMEELVGQLNGGRRVDYVLQEAPLESFNDYLFALGSHACYWESEDTILMMLKEIYLTLNILPESRPSDMSSSSSMNLSNSNQEFIKNKNPNCFQRPPLLPLISPTSVIGAVLPQTFHNVQAKPFFVPNFTPDQSIEPRLNSNSQDKHIPVLPNKTYDPMLPNITNKTTEPLTHLQKTHIDQSQHVKFTSKDFMPPIATIRGVEEIGVGHEFPNNPSTQPPKMPDFYQNERRFEPECSNFVPITQLQVDSLFEPPPTSYPLVTAPQKTENKVHETEGLIVVQDSAIISPVDSTSFSDRIASDTFQSSAWPVDRHAAKLVEEPSLFNTTNLGKMPSHFLDSCSNRSFGSNTTETIIDRGEMSPNMETVPLESPSEEIPSDPAADDLSKYHFSQINLTGPRSTIDSDPFGGVTLDQQSIPPVTMMPNMPLPPMMPLDHHPSMSFAARTSRNNYVYPQALLETKKQPMDLKYPPVAMPNRYMTTFQPRQIADDMEPPMELNTTKHVPLVHGQQPFIEPPPSLPPPPPTNIVTQLFATVPNKPDEPQISHFTEINFSTDAHRSATSLSNEGDGNIRSSKMATKFDLPPQLGQNQSINPFQPEISAETESWKSSTLPTQPANLQYPPMWGNQLMNVFQPTIDKETTTSSDTHFTPSPTNVIDTTSQSAGPIASGHDQRPNLPASNNNASLLSMFKQSTDSDFDSLFMPDSQCRPPVTAAAASTGSRNNSITSCASDRTGTNNYHPTTRISQLKSNHELPSNSCRTPSPKIPYQNNARNSPKGNPAASSSIFSSKPLVPQSGKLFKKK